MATALQTIFSSAFSWLKATEFWFKFSLMLSLRGYKPSLIQVMTRCRADETITWTNDVPVQWRMGGNTINAISSLLTLKQLGRFCLFLFIYFILFLFFFYFFWGGGVQNVTFFPLEIWYFGTRLVQCNEYFISTVDTDGMVLQHQGIRIHSAEYAPMRFQLFRG